MEIISGSWTFASQKFASRSENRAYHAKSRRDLMKESSNGVLRFEIPFDGSVIGIGFNEKNTLHFNLKDIGDKTLAQLYIKIHPFFM